MVLPFHRTKTTSCSGFDVANYCQRAKVFWIVVNILHSKKTLSPQIHFSDTAVSFEVHCWTATTDTKKLESEDLTGKSILKDCALLQADLAKTNQTPQKRMQGGWNDTLQLENLHVLDLITHLCLSPEAEKGTGQNNEDSIWQWL